MTRSTGGFGRYMHISMTVMGATALIVGLAVTGAAAKGGGGSGHHDDDSHGLSQRVAKLEYEQQIAEARLEITSKQSEYGLLFNGDGPNGPDRAKWGREIFTGNDAFLAYDYNNQLIPSQSFAHMSDEIAAAIAGQPTTWPDATRPNGSMHFMYAPVFDSITPTTAVTRTPSVSISGVKGTGAPVSVTIRVYWDTWKKTSVGWRKVTSTWYRLD
jgi:hypothetical protein